MKGVVPLTLQRSLLQAFNEINQVREKGIHHVLNLDDISSMCFYSIYPEFVSSSILNSRNIAINPTHDKDENQKRFENREILYSNDKLCSNMSFDGLEYIQRQISRRVSQKNKKVNVSLYMEVTKLYNLYCSEEFIPKSCLPSFPKQWIFAILKSFKETDLRKWELRIRDHFKNITDIYFNSIRVGIVNYILCSPKERLRIKIPFMPFQNELTSVEKLCLEGGYNRMLNKD